MSKKYSRKELLQALQELSEKLDRTPKKKDLRKNDSSPSPTPYYREFGSLIDAVKAAGLEPDEDGETRKKYSREELLLCIRDLAEDLERTPTKAEMKNKDSFPSPDTYYERFGSWTNAVEEAGFEPSNHGSKYTHEELTDEIQHVVENLGRVPTQQEMRAYGEISPDTYHDRFANNSKKHFTTLLRDSNEPQPEMKCANLACTIQIRIDGNSGRGQTRFESVDLNQRKKKIQTMKNSSSIFVILLRNSGIHRAKKT